MMFDCVLRCAGQIRRLVSIVLLGALTGCAIIPGDLAFDMRQQSATKLPVKQAEEVIPANVKVTPITAELIIEQEAALRKARDPAGTGGSRPAKNMIDVIADYKIGPGDILNITVWDHPELTIPAGSFRGAAESGTLVAEDGTIFYPYVGVLRVAGKTPREVRALLEERLAKVIEKPQVDVRVISFRSKRLYVVGEVAKPGLQEINDIPMTIVEAINRAGGFTKDSDQSQVLLTRGDSTWRVDIQALYEEGAVSQNVPLEPNDIVNVMDRQFNKVFVLGEVRNPGSYFMNKRRITLAEALSDAGYITQLSANPHWIFVMRGQADSPEIFHLDSKSPDALLLADRFPLRPRDIVYVDAAELALWNRVMNNLLPTINLLNLSSGAQFPLFRGN